MNLKDRLKELRLKANLTQEQLANNTGISQVSIKSYEAGRRQPNSKAMVILERYFNVSGAYLRGEIDQLKWEDMAMIEVIDDNLPIAANTLITSARNGSDKTTANLFDIMIELRSLMNAEQKRGTDAHSDFATKVFIETMYCIQKLIANEERPEKWDQLSGETTFKISRLFMNFQTELLEQKKNPKNN